MHKIIIAYKEISLKAPAIDLLFDNIVKTTDITPEEKTAFMNKIIASWNYGEQKDLLDEMNDERIYPLGYVVKD